MQALLAAAAAAAGGGAPAAVPPKLLEALATRPRSASSGTEGAAEALARATAEIERQQTVRAALQAASQEVEQGMSLAVASLCKIATSSASSADTAQAGVRAELEEHKAMVASLEQKLSAERARAAAAEEREKDLATKLTTLRETFLSLGLQAPILASPTPKPPTSTAAQSVVVDDDDEGDAGQAERAAQVKDEGGVAVDAGGVVHEEAAQGSAVQAEGGAGAEEDDEEESAPLALPPTKLVPLDTTAEETSAVGAGDSSRQASRPGGQGAGEGAPEPAPEVGGYRLVQVSSSVGVPMGAGEAQLGRDLSSRVPGMDALSMKVHRVHAKLVVPPDASGAFTLTRVGKNSLTVLPKEVAITLGLLKEDGEGGLSLMAGRDVQEAVGQAKGDGSALVLGLNEPATVQVGDIIVFVDNAACSFLLQATAAARGTKRERGGGGTSPPAKKAREEG